MRDPRATPGRVARIGTALVVVVLLSAGCGGGESPSDAAPDAPELGFAQRPQPPEPPPARADDRSPGPARALDGRPSASWEVAAFASPRGHARGGEAVAPPPSVASEPAVLEDCRERFVIVPGDDEAVSERVPRQFEISRDSSGRPLVYVGTGHCERYTVDGVTRPTTWAAFMVNIASPDGRGCLSGWPVVGEVKGDLISCNLYILFVAYDNPHVVAWARRGAPDSPAHHVGSHVFRQEALDVTGLGAPFHFEAAPETPSPFTLDAVVRERRVPHPFAGAFWTIGSSGTTVFRFAADRVAPGEADGRVEAEAGSEMAELLGTTTPTPAPGFGLLGALEWSYGEITREHPAGDGGNVGEEPS